VVPSQRRERGSHVVFLCGFIENWRTCFSLLAAKHRVYALDLPGFGLTDKPLNTSYSITNFVAFAREFMATLGIERASLVGHSLGGAIAAQFTLQFPKMVEKLILVNSAGLGKEAAFALRLLSLPLIGEMLSRPSRSGTEQSLQLYVHDQASITEEEIDLSYQMAAQPGRQQALLETVRGVGNLSGQKKSFYEPLCSELKTIRQPTLVIWGRQDQIVPVIHAEVAAQSIPDVRVEIFDNCGHVPMLEQSQAFTRALLEFLQN
jgi:4,5:9,10-diseco-3-hydroxy-5,9,17-trioxoandrosta-1(10),2-diene-4-oate hydrolase